MKRKGNSNSRCSCKGQCGDSCNSRFVRKIVLKQQKLEGPLTTEAVKGLSSEDMDLMDEESSRKSAKVL